MGSAAFILLTVDAGADLVTRGDTDGVSHDYHGKSDEEQHKGSLQSGHLFCRVEYREAVTRRQVAVCSVWQFPSYLYESVPDRCLMLLLLDRFVPNCLHA